MPVPIETRVDLAPRRLLRDTVAESIRDAILDGSFRPGERLHDDELQTWLGVSRTPIRDALNELSRAGLVEMAPNRYTRVADPDARAASESLATIGVMLAGILHLAAPRMSPLERRECATGVDSVLAELAAGDGPALGAACHELLSSTAKLCENGVLTRVCEETSWGLVFRVTVGYVSPAGGDPIASLYEDLRTEVTMTEHRPLHHDTHRHATPSHPRSAVAAH